jgi:hypothetical protein
MKKQNVKGGFWSKMFGGNKEKEKEKIKEQIIKQHLAKG